MSQKNLGHEDQTSKFLGEHCDVCVKPTLCITCTWYLLAAHQREEWGVEIYAAHQDRPSAPTPPPAACLRFFSSCSRPFCSPCLRQRPYKKKFDPLFSPVQPHTQLRQPSSLSLPPSLSSGQLATLGPRIANLQ